MKAPSFRVCLPQRTFYRYLIEHDHLALWMVVSRLRGTDCDCVTLGYYLFAPGKRHAEQRNAESLSKEIAAECGGERGEGRGGAVVNLKQAQCCPMSPAMQSTAPERAKEHGAHTTAIQRPSEAVAT